MKVFLATMLACLALSACSQTKKAGGSSPEALCAAEALKSARAAGGDFEREQRLRAEVELFTARLEASGLQDPSRQVDELADRNAGRTLIDRNACKALLTVADRKQLDDLPQGPFTNLERATRK